MTTENGHERHDVHFCSRCSVNRLQYWRPYLNLFQCGFGVFIEETQRLINWLLCFWNLTYNNTWREDWSRVEILALHHLRPKLETKVGWMRFSLLSATPRLIVNVSHCALLFPGLLSESSRIWLLVSIAWEMQQYTRQSKVGVWGGGTILGCDFVHTKKIIITQVPKLTVPETLRCTLAQEST
jgi:hypothetical protein